ncbi:hypothetical protein [Agathobaculum butyriciproducens]|uniref:hypothetical protein n=1 Tax=Agathobaculum butyriciproducens TaxID=1628085 RepID=UPI0036D385CF
MLALLLGLLCTGLTACGRTSYRKRTKRRPAPTVEQPEEPEPTPEEVRRTAAGSMRTESDARGVARMFFVRCPETDAAALTAPDTISAAICCLCAILTARPKNPSQNTINLHAQKRPCSSARTRKAARSCASAQAESA